MEYREKPLMGDDEFAELDAQEYLPVEDCSGGEEHFVCIATAANDEQNGNRGDMMICQKKYQCKACYWFNTGINMLVMVKYTGKTNRVFNQLVDDLDKDLKLFNMTA